MTDEAIVRLKIVSTHQTSEQITKIVGIPCDKSWKIGDTRGKTVIIEKNNGWVLNSNLPKSASLETQIEKLLERLTPNADKIRTLAEHNDVELSCVIYARETPALNFNAEIVKKLCGLGAGLDIDLYLG